MSAPPIIPLCSHIKTDGAQCQSPALKGQTLCYYHRNLILTHRRPLIAIPMTSSDQECAIDRETVHGEEDDFAIITAYPGQDDIEFPPLEDAEAVQLATSMLFHAIATGRIHFKHARMLIQTLKIASSNQRVVALSRAQTAAVATMAQPTHPAPSGPTPDSETPAPETAAPADQPSENLEPPPSRFYPIKPRYHPDIIGPLGFKESPYGGLYPLSYCP